MQRHCLLLGCDESALYEELVLAFRVQRRLLLEGLKHNYQGVVNTFGVAMAQPQGNTYQRHRRSRQARHAPNLAVHSTATRRRVSAHA